MRGPPLQHCTHPFPGASPLHPCLVTTRTVLSAPLQAPAPHCFSENTGAAALGLGPGPGPAAQLLIPSVRGEAEGRELFVPALGPLHTGCVGLFRALLSFLMLQDGLRWRRVLCACQVLQEPWFLQVSKAKKPRLATSSCGCDGWACQGAVGDTGTLQVSAAFTETTPPSLETGLAREGICPSPSEPCRPQSLALRLPMCPDTFYDRPSCLLAKTKRLKLGVATCPWAYTISGNL